MIKKGNKLLQVSVDQKVIMAMDESCKALSDKLHVHVTKGMLVTFLFNNWIASIQKLDNSSTENKEESQDVE